MRSNGVKLPIVGIALLCMLSLEGHIAGGSEARMLFASRADNDLFRSVATHFQERVVRFDSPAEALEDAARDDLLFVLADHYPSQPSNVDRAFLEAARQKGVRMYLEYPQLLAEPAAGKLEPISSTVERVVVAGGSFGLPRLSILQVNGLHYLPVNGDLAVEFDEPILVAARVAGFDSAILGLPERTSPLLVSTSAGDALIAATGLSHFRRGRYSPYGAWQALWQNVLQWMLREQEPVELTLGPPVVAATYSQGDSLPPGAQRAAVARALRWYSKSKMLIHPNWEHRLLESNETGRLARIDQELPVGDGSLGSMEAVLSIIDADGRQAVSTVRRGDCICESAMAFAASAQLLNRPQAAQVSRNLIDYYLFQSPACQKERGNPDHPAYGLIAWGITNPAWYKANYGDDNARIMLSTMAVAGLLGEDRWNETIARCLVANLRTTGKFGFRGDRIDIEPLAENGWRHYFHSQTISYAPHFEAYLWACYLWAYAQTGDPLLIDRAKTALKMTMQKYPDGWRWTNGLAQERARIVLPLAWLVRVEDTAEHRQLLQQAVRGLISIQHETGAIREELGAPEMGMFPPPESNESYGVTEASLIARNGDPVADMLYTNNFALLGLHEAAAATGDPQIREAEDRLAQFLIRIQAQSKTVPEVDGGWLRAFDFKRWEPWGSNADIGWGAWSIESGWTQGWITTVLAMREMETSLWEWISASRIEGCYPAIRESMLPQSHVEASEISRVK